MLNTYIATKNTYIHIRIGTLKKAHSLNLNELFYYLCFFIFSFFGFQEYIQIFRIPFAVYKKYN